LDGIDKDKNNDEYDLVEYKQKKFYKSKDGQSSKKLFKVKDYLPQESHAGWFEVPATTVEIEDANLIDNRDFIGVNTIGTSKRISNLDIRPRPPNPRVQVSPWNQSTVDPDLNTQCLC